MAESMSDEELMAALSLSPASALSDEELMARLGPVGTPFQGAAETAMTVGSSMISEPVAGLVGIGGRVANAALNQPQDDAQIIDSVRQGLTYQPRTQTGQRYVQNVAGALQPIGEALEYVEKGLGDAVYNVTGSPALAAGAQTIPTLAGSALGLGGGRALARADIPSLNDMSKAARRRKATPEDIRAIEAGETQTVGKRIEDGRIARDKPERSAQNQGVDDGVIGMIRTASKADKANMRRMIGMVERGLKNRRFAALNPPSRVVGDQIAGLYKHVAEVNKKSGKAVNRVAEGLKGKSVDYRPAVDGFLSSLDKMGIKFDGSKVSFRNSDIQGLRGLELITKKVISRMADVDNVDAYKVHQLKRFLDESIKYGKTTEGLGGRLEVALRKLRADLDNALDSTFDEYNKVNSIFAETRSVLDGLESSVSKKIDFDGPNVDRALGIESRKLLSNYASGNEQLGALDELVEVANKYTDTRALEPPNEKLPPPAPGPKFDGDLISQVTFFTELNRLFPQSFKNTFQGDIEKALDNVGRRGWEGVKDAAIDEGVKAVRGKFRNEEKLIEALKGLLAESSQP